MFKTANDELSRELYSLTGWNDTYLFSDGSVWFTQENLEAGDVDLNDPDDNLTPMYDLGYLLRKLPKGYEWNVTYQNLCLWPLEEDGKWYAVYENKRGVRHLEQSADTPEDAATKLAIELFKQGILTKDKQ